MALRAIIESLEGIPEELHEHYKEQDEQFILDVEAVEGWNLEDVGGLKSALQTKKTEVIDLKTQLESFDGIDLEEYKKALERAENLVDKGEVDNRISQLNEKHRSEIEKSKGRERFLIDELKRNLIGNAANQAIAKFNGFPHLLLPAIERNAKVVESDSRFMVHIKNDRGETLITTKANSTDPMGIEEYVENLSKNKDYAGDFKASGASGSGATGNTQKTVSASESGSVKKVSAGDQEAINAHAAEIAAGTVIVE